jgi:hypothetical protein
MCSHESAARGSLHRAFFGGGQLPAPPRPRRLALSSSAQHSSSTQAACCGDRPRSLAIGQSVAHHADRATDMTSSCSSSFAPQPEGGQRGGGQVRARTPACRVRTRHALSANAQVRAPRHSAGGAQPSAGAAGSPRCSARTQPAAAHGLPADPVPGRRRERGRRNTRRPAGLGQASSSAEAHQRARLQQPRSSPAGRRRRLQPLGPLQRWCGLPAAAPCVCCAATGAGSRMQRLCSGDGE